MIVFVTGASAGFGAAIARTFVKGGHRVIAAARRKERLVALSNELGDALLPVELDVRDENAVRNAIASLPEAFAQIDVLVNNAGLALGLEPAQRANLDDWKDMIETNCTGLVTVTHAILPGMIERNRGHVFNIGSVAGTYPYTGGNVYGATKAFVRQFSLNLRADVAGTALRVTDIEPGLVRRHRIFQRALQGRRHQGGDRIQGRAGAHARGYRRRDLLDRHASGAREYQRNRDDAGRADVRTVANSPRLIRISA